MLVCLLMAWASGLPWWSIIIVLTLAIGIVAFIAVVVNILYKLAKWADII